MSRPEAATTSAAVVLGAQIRKPIAHADGVLHDAATRDDLRRQLAAITEGARG